MLIITIQFGFHNAAIATLAMISNQLTNDCMGKYNFLHLFVSFLQWAHFPHIHFGLMPDQPVKKANVRQQVLLIETLRIQNQQRIGETAHFQGLLISFKFVFCILQEGEDVLMTDEFFAAANVGVTPY